MVSRIAAAQNRHGLREGVGTVEQRRQPLAQHGLELVPVASGLVAVGNGGQVEAARGTQEVPKLEGRVLCGDVVQPGSRIAGEGVHPEVCVGQPQVGVVGVLVHVTEPEFERLVKRGIPTGADAELPLVILQPVAGAVPSRQLLEACVCHLIGLDEGAPALAGRAHGDLPLRGTERAASDLGRERGPLGDRGRDQVDCATGRARAVPHLAGSLSHLDPIHPTHGGEVVGGRCGVRCRGDQDSVLHHGDLRVAIGPGAADPDIGPQTQTLLLADAYTGHTAEHGVHVVEQQGTVIQVAAPEVVGCPGGRYPANRVSDHPGPLGEDDQGVESHGVHREWHGDDTPRLHSPFDRFVAQEGETEEDALALPCALDGTESESPGRGREGPTVSPQQMNGDTRKRGAGPRIHNGTRDDRAALSGQWKCGKSGECRKEQQQMKRCVRPSRCHLRSTRPCGLLKGVSMSKSRAAVRLRVILKRIRSYAESMGLSTMPTHRP